MSNEANPGLLPSQEQMFEMIRDLQKKAKEEKARKDQKIAALEGQFEDFNEYMKDNMVPIKEKVLGPKRMSQKDREYEVERVTRSYKRAADKKAVGFIADWRIDVRERQEAVVRLSKFREVFEDDSLGDFSWDKEETRKEILAFVDFIGQESEDARRKLLEVGLLRYREGLQVGLECCPSLQASQNLRAWGRQPGPQLQGEGTDIRGKK